MRSALLGLYEPQHAKPALHPTRTTLSTGLTAVLLPLCLAGPAFADDTAPGSPPAAATSTATMDAEPAPSESAPAPAPAKQETTLRISGPRGAVSPGKHAIGVRLLADGKGVKNGYVRVERKTANGWTFIGRLLTDGTGLGVGKFSLTSTSRLRAVYTGASTRTAGQSSEIVVQVADSFRAQALRVAAAQNGKPYRYGSSGPSSFDCSGLVRYAFSKAGRNLPHSSSAQYSATQRISKSAAQPGDLVFMRSGGRISHVGVYAGGGTFWDAPTSGGHVSKRRIYTSSYEVGRVN